FCRWKIFRMIEASGCDVDLIGTTVGFVGERCAAGVAEGSKCSGVSLVSMRLAGFPFELGALHDDPRYSLCAGRAPTIFAMTIRGHTRFALYRESNFAAVTAAGDHDHVITQNVPQIETKLVRTRCIIDNLA